MLKATPLVQERIKTLSESVDWLGFFFTDTVELSPERLIAKKMDAAGSYAALQRARDCLSELPDFSEETIEVHLRQLVKDLGLKAGQVFGLIREAVTGLKAAPPLCSGPWRYSAGNAP